MNNQKSFLKPFSLQPALAWTAILGLIFITTLCIMAGLGKILNLLFPAGALGVGVFLYFRYPLLYLGFTWWLWFLTPFIRRLSDYRSSYTEPSPILLAPFLVTFVSSITLWRHLPKLNQKGGFPYILSLLAVLYGFLVGLINRSPVKVGIALLDWVCPVLFGLHIFINWKNYLSYRKTIHRIFLWGVIVMGAYGIMQFLIAPEWDIYWLIKSEFASGGKPEPLGLNVWSTMASNQPFGTVMTAGLLLLLVNPNKGNVAAPATGLGYLSFLLARKRTTWATWLFGLLLLTGSLKANIKIRIIITIILTAICVVPLVTLEPFSNFIGDRFTTITQIEGDTSAEARQETYSELIDDAFNSYLGKGIGGLPHDSGILSSLLDLGWFGTFCYFSGVLILMFSLFQGSETRADPFASAACAIAISTLIQLPLARPHVEVQGMILWGFMSLGIAAKKYNKFNQKLQSLYYLEPDHLNNH
ncbi:MAG: O-antigen ligase domain-containing protein [Microcoleaceae cyanobacterium]